MIPIINFELIMMFILEVTIKSFFHFNRVGLFDSFDNNLKTTNAFNLGGLNFKGFDYRGVGPTSGDIYLGGNNFYTVTLGYGSNFVDKKDNLNFRSATEVPYGTVIMRQIIILRIEFQLVYP